MQIVANIESTVIAFNFIKYLIRFSYNRVIECRGPTNTRVYVVAVYFRDQRLATGKGHSIQEAEMSAASNALESSRGLI